MQGASERWAQRVARAASPTNTSPKRCATNCIYGGFGGPGIRSVSHQGAGLKIWASQTAHNTVTDARVFKGAATIATARQVYGIRNPEEKQLALF